MSDDIAKLRAGVHIVVGTPGRVLDMLCRNVLRPDRIKMFVLDEADEMLSRGFKDQIYDIFQALPPRTQVSHSLILSFIARDQYYICFYYYYYLFSPAVADCIRVGWFVLCHHAP